MKEGTYECIKDLSVQILFIYLLIYQHKYMNGWYYYRMVIISMKYGHDLLQLSNTVIGTNRLESLILFDHKEAAVKCTKTL